jgi:hypothetical protein
MKTKKEHGKQFSFTDSLGKTISVVEIITYRQSLAGGVESWYVADREYRTADLTRPIGHTNHQYFQSPYDQLYYSPA